MERLRILLKYIVYRITAGHRKGHGIHSPFMFRLVSEVISGKKEVRPPMEVISWHDELLRDKRKIATGNFGAGSHSGKRKVRKISHVARHAGVNKKHGRLLYRLASWLQPAEILELGTGIGISTAYLRTGAPGTRMISVEGEKEKSEFAAREFRRNGFGETDFVNSDFESALKDYHLRGHPWIVFLDGDHSYASTMKYYRILSALAGHDTVMIFHDIHWSAGMQKAWKEIRKDNDSVLTLDLFFVGLIFFREGVVSQDFIVKF
jgi:predicted O-methyltransferase YrrM